MKDKGNAIEIIGRIVARNKDIAEITFAAYYYVPQSLSDKGKLRLYRFTKPTLARVNRFVPALLKRLKTEWALGLTSRVKLRNGEYRHIPQIDFACPQSSKHTGRVLECLRRFVKVRPGFLLASGRSYHYYGLSLLDQRQWEIFIGNCLLCNPTDKKSVVDARWFAYSMRRGYSNLRITASDSKPEPRVLTRI